MRISQLISKLEAIRAQCYGRDEEVILRVDNLAHDVRVLGASFEARDSWGVEDGLFSDLEEGTQHTYAVIVGGALRGAKR